MSKLTLHMSNQDILSPEPNKLSELSNAIYPYTWMQAFGVNKITTDRYTLDHEHAIKESKQHED